MTRLFRAAGRHARAVTLAVGCGFALSAAAAAAGPRLDTVAAGDRIALANPATGAETSGDAERGKAVYSRCIACHALAYDRTGPRHCGLLGRRAGSVPGYPYSAAMKRSGIVWTTATLDAFLADPMKTVPGTSMGYAGVKDLRDRTDLVSYLARASDAAECRGD
jgi:cytochrome c